MTNNNDYGEKIAKIKDIDIMLTDDKNLNWQTRRNYVKQKAVLEKELSILKQERFTNRADQIIGLLTEIRNELRRLNQGEV